MTLHAKMARSDSQWYPCNFYLINNVNEIVVFLALQVFISNNSNMFSCSRNAQDFTYRPFITVIIPAKVFVKSKKTKFYTRKKSFKALIFIFKLSGVCNLFLSRFHFWNYFIFKSIINISLLFFAGLEKDSAEIRQGFSNYPGSNRMLLGSWPQAPPPLCFQICSLIFIFPDLKMLPDQNFIRQSFYWYHCESDISIFAWRVTWNCSKQSL